jgi:hypothetical protein
MAASNGFHFQICLHPGVYERSFKPVIAKKPSAGALLSVCAVGDMPAGISLAKPSQELRADESRVTRTYPCGPAGLLPSIALVIGRPGSGKGYFVRTQIERCLGASFSDPEFIIGNPKLSPLGAKKNTVYLFTAPKEIPLSIRVNASYIVFTTAEAFDRYFELYADGADICSVVRAWKHAGSDTGVAIYDTAMGVFLLGATVKSMPG